MGLGKIGAATSRRVKRHQVLQIFNSLCSKSSMLTVSLPQATIITAYIVLYDSAQHTVNELELSSRSLLDGTMPTI